MHPAEKNEVFTVLDGLFGEFVAVLKVDVLALLLILPADQLDVLGLVYYLAFFLNLRVIGTVITSVLTVRAILVIKP